MARYIKSLQRKIDKEQGSGYAHRDHRSKKNRRPQTGWAMKSAKLFKRRKEELRLKDLDNNPPV